MQDNLDWFVLFEHARSKRVVDKKIIGDSFFIFFFVLFFLAFIGDSFFFFVLLAFTARQGPAFF